ncbi:MAG: hypothetical protein AAF226_19610 [Verrucomicrobiota bacterium]
MKPHSDSIEFWAHYPELCWSNRQASDTIHIRAALCRPRFMCLLDVAKRFGLSRLKEEWSLLIDEVELAPEVEVARPTVERIIKNIEEGFQSATA